MPSQLGEAFVAITGRDISLKKNLAQAEKDVKSSTDRMSGRFQQMSARFALIGTRMTLGLTMPIIGGFGVATKLAIDAEQASVDLASALRKAGDAGGDTQEKLENLAKAIQKKTVYDDEAIISGMAYAKNLGVQTGQLEESAKAAVGLAAKYKIDLNTAFMLLGRAANGNTMMLKRYGITLADNLTPQQKMNELLKIGADNFKLAEDQANSSSGKMLKLRHAMEELGETVGGMVLPYVQSATEAAQSLANALDSMSPGMKRFAVLAAAITAAIGPMLIGLANLPKLAAGWGIVAGWAGRIGTAIKGVTVAVQALGVRAALTRMVFVRFASLGLGGWATLAVAAIGAVVIALKKFDDKLDETLEKTQGASSVNKLSIPKGQTAEELTKYRKEQFEEWRKLNSERDALVEKYKKKGDSLLSYAWPGVENEKVGDQERYQELSKQIARQRKLLTELDKFVAKKKADTAMPDTSNLTQSASDEQRKLADSLWDTIQARRADKEAIEQEHRALIGFTTGAQLWEKAAVTGLQFRYSARKESAAMMALGTIGAASGISAREADEAIKIMVQQNNILKSIQEVLVPYVKQNQGLLVTP